jgi:hypothetical protein
MKTKTIAMAGALLALTGCSRMTTRNAASDSARNQASAESGLCKDMSRSQASIKNFPDVSAETSLREIQKANRKAEDAVSEVGKVAKKIDNPRVLELQSAFQELRNAVDTIPGGRSTVGPAADDVHASAIKLRRTWESLYASLQCGA